MPSSLQGLATRARQRAAIRRIDPVGRAAYGFLCIASMAALAMPVLLVAGPAAAILELMDGHGSDALLFWLGSWGTAALAGVLFLAIFYTAWPLAADWIMEWPGYAVGFAIAGIWLTILALLIFALSAPLYLAIPLPLIGAFGAGVAVAGALAGLKAPSARPRAKAKTLRRR